MCFSQIFDDAKIVGANGRPQEGTPTTATNLEVSMEATQACILDQDSGARRLFEAIGDKWSLLVVYALEAGTLRFNALERALPGISQKVLTQSLKRLEAAGLVARQAYAEVPLRVEYRLTPLGQDLQPVTAAICNWADAHAGRLAAHNTARRGAR
jgi:DNA-binding HxlR family transcriptional regulator